MAKQIEIWMPGERVWTLVEGKLECYEVGKYGEGFIQLKGTDKAKAYDALPNADRRSTE